MRVIKFRAWDLENNYMFQVHTLSLPVNLRVHTELMQFTGLSDSKGVEIYEGDIVCNEGFKEEVKWDKFYGWVVSDEQMLGEVNFARMEVIGNIYENPELLND